MVYYFGCSYPLEKNSVVKKGNWGRICRLEAFNPRLLTELVFENIRLQKFPHLPSRFNCVFLCSNKESLTCFIQQQKRPFDLLYEVELVNPSANTFETDWSVFKTYNSIVESENAAFRYWEPKEIPNQFKEILTK